MENKPEENTQKMPKCPSSYATTYDTFKDFPVDDCVIANNLLLDQMQEKMANKVEEVTLKEIERLESCLMALHDLIEEKDPSVLHNIQ